MRITFLFGLMCLLTTTHIALSNEINISSDCRNSGCSIPDGAERIIFDGILSKNKTQDPRVLGGSVFLHNETNAEYRIVKFNYLLDTSLIKREEAVETDIGFAILPKGKANSLNSGEEILITHQYDVSSSRREATSSAIPAGGFPLPSGHSLSVGSTSGFYLPGRGANEIGADRLESGQLTAMRFRVELERADRVQSAKVTSYRSPYRDRSYVVDGNRLYAPYTDFINMSAKDINIYGLGIFLSNLTSLEESNHEIEVRINDKVVRTVETPDHVPGTTSRALPLIEPLNLSLKPNDQLSVRARVSAPKAIVFDFAAFIIGDAGLEPYGEQLETISADINGDGYSDLIDIDKDGTIWVSLRVAAGLQDTQQPWLNKLGKIELLEPWKDGDKTIGLIAKNTDGLCLHLKSHIQAMNFQPGYCDGEIGNISNTEAWGDYNGDGWPDRLLIEAENLRYVVALGGKEGLGDSTPWVSGFGNVERIFAFDGNNDGKTDVLTEWYEGGGYHCMLWRSDGQKFIGTSCR